MITAVTGATGFVGMNIVEALLGRGDEVVAFGQGALPPAAKQVFAKFAKQLRAVEGDIRDASCVERLFSERRVDRLVHAAVITAGPERERRDPQSIIDVNVLGTIRILEAAHRHGVGRMVYVSSGAAYGESRSIAARLYEDITPSRPVNFYSITKLAAERAALRLRDLWRLDLVCARLGSVVGPWERDTGVRDNLSPQLQLARLAASGKRAVLPQREPRKDCIYSRDVAAGIVALLEAGSPGHALYHLTSGRDWNGTLPEWCEQLRTIFNSFEYRAGNGGEQTNLLLDTQDRGAMDIGRIVQDIGFAPAFGPREAYADYAQWLRNHPGFLGAVLKTENKE